MLLSAEEYDKWYYTERGEYISELEKGVLLELVTRNLKLGTCIDIGCGTGYFTEFLSGFCKNIVGVDTSMDMIKYAIKKHRDSNIKYLIADAENLPFKNGSFDISVSITAVNFFNNPAKSVSEAVRISRKKIFLGVLNRWSLLFFFKKLKSLLKETSYSNACFYSQGYIVNILSTPHITYYEEDSSQRFMCGVRGIQKRHTYFLPFPKIHSILAGIERIIPSWLPFGGFMGIAGDI